MKKYLLLLFLPLFALSCSSDDDVETIEDRIKSSIVESLGITNLIEYTQTKEVGEYEDSEMYKQIMAGNVTITIEEHTLTIPETIEHYRQYFTTTMYNCLVKCKQDGYLLSYILCVNSKEMVFILNLETSKVN